MTIKAILFDLDGTLVDSNDFHVEAWQQAFRSGGHEFETKAIHAQIGKGADKFVPALIPGIDPDEVESLGAAQKKVFTRDFLPRVQGFPAAADLLRRAHERGQRVVLASSASGEELDHYVDLLGIGEIMEASTSGDDVENTKPAPDIFAAALKKVAPLTAAEVIVIGDSPFDVEAATACGIATIAVRSGGFTDEVLHKAGALALYDDIAALLDDYDASPLGR